MLISYTSGNTMVENQIVNSVDTRIKTLFPKWNEYVIAKIRLCKIEFFRYTLFYTSRLIVAFISLSVYLPFERVTQSIYLWFIIPKNSNNKYLTPINANQYIFSMNNIQCCKPPTPKKKQITKTQPELNMSHCHNIYNWNSNKYDVNGLYYIKLERKRN